MSLTGTTVYNEALLTQNGWRQIDAAASTQGKAIGLYTLTSDTSKTLNTLIFAAIHGDEVESISLLEAWAAQATKTMPALSAIGIIPVLNPDGVVAGTRKNANQIDINRNFPTANWGKPSEPNAEHLRQAAVETNASSDHYFAGYEAGSEAETQFLMHVVEAYAPQKIISLHTPYRVINYDGPALELAQRMAQENGYDVVADIGYPTPGSFGNYAGIERNIPVITLELPEGDAFTPEELRKNILALNAIIAL